MKLNNFRGINFEFCNLLKLIVQLLFSTASCYLVKYYFFQHTTFWIYFLPSVDDFILLFTLYSKPILVHNFLAWWCGHQDATRLVLIWNSIDVIFLDWGFCRIMSLPPPLFIDVLSESLFKRGFNKHVRQTLMKWKFELENFLFLGSDS